MSTRVRRRIPRFASACVVAMSGIAILSPTHGQAQHSRVEELMADALKRTPVTSEGARVFDQHCASCHGRRGEGDAQAVVPALAGQLKIYLVKQLADMAEGNRESVEMHRLVARAELSRAQALADVAGFLSALPRLKRPQVGDGRRLRSGEQTFERFCAQCHGFQAQGDIQMRAPALQGQHFSYLLMQSRQMPVKHGYSIGVETLERFEDLTLEELQAVCDYIARIEVRARGEATTVSLGISP